MYKYLFLKSFPFFNDHKKNPYNYETGFNELKCYVNKVVIILLTWTHVIILHRHLRELVIRQQRDNQLYVTTDSWKFPARTNDLILLKDRGRADGQQINHIMIFINS